MKKVLLSLVAVLLFTVVSVSFAAPVTLVSESTLLAGQSRTTVSNTYAHAIDGQTAYVSLMKGGVTKITNLNGTQTSSVLFTQSDWSSASGGSGSLTDFYGFGVSGNYLVWSDTLTHSVWKADKITGAITQVISRTAIQNYLGIATSKNNAAQTIAPDGSFTFVESNSKTILNVDLNGNLTTLATFSSYTVASGLTYDTSNRLYYGSNDTDSVYRLNTNGTIETLITSDDIYEITGGANATINDIFYGSNGWVYFYEQVDKSILQFNVNDPTGTLSVLVENSGRAQTFGLYSNGGIDYLTYHDYTGDLLAVQIPEPATVSILVLGSMGLGLFRKRQMV